MQAENRKVIEQSGYVRIIDIQSGQNLFEDAVYPNRRYDERSRRTQPVGVFVRRRTFRILIMDGTRAIFALRRILFPHDLRQAEVRTCTGTAVIHQIPVCDVFVRRKFNISEFSGYGISELRTDERIGQFVVGILVENERPRADGYAVHHQLRSELLHARFHQHGRNESEQPAYLRRQRKGDRRGYRYEDVIRLEERIVESQRNFLFRSDIQYLSVGSYLQHGYPNFPRSLLRSYFFICSRSPFFPKSVT